MEMSAMKKLLTFFYASLLLSIVSCSDEKIEPQPLTEDLKTSANGYWDQDFSIHITTNYEDNISFRLSGTGGEITVDWGDGSSESKYVGEDELTFEHIFDRDEENPESFAITVSGDIETITGFNFFYAGLYVDEIHFGGLTNLNDLSMGVLANGPREIDLSQNKLIQNVILPGVQRLENLILPASNKIRGIDIAGTNQLSTANVDHIIARVHDSVVRSPRTGFFGLPASWAQEEGDMSMAGPPSSNSINKLRKLKRKYGWNIYPEVR
jgi:hypothetical protein